MNTQLQKKHKTFNLEFLFNSKIHITASVLICQIMLSSSSKCFNYGFTHSKSCYIWIIVSINLSRFFFVLQYTRDIFHYKHCSSFFKKKCGNIKYLLGTPAESYNGVFLLNLCCKQQNESECVSLLCLIQIQLAINPLQFRYIIFTT